MANAKLTPELAFSLGQGAGRWLADQFDGARIVVGEDTRRSGPMLTASLMAGFCSAGVDADDMGVMPTPAVSYVARTQGYSLGAIVSASHNPAPDNGIKFVGSDGRKLPDEHEERIEALMGVPFAPRPQGEAIGSIGLVEDAKEAYLEHLLPILPEGLKGWTVAVDAANGAAFELAPEMLRRLGATVLVTGDTPNGNNINAEGGATKPGTIGAFTVASKAQIGISYDGDADRVVFCDEKGRLINGDRTMSVWAEFQLRHGLLSPPVIVGTVMSNGGFEQRLSESGIRLERAPVGDKYVAQRIESSGALVGGEQSGHIIFPSHGPTGDGLATTLEFLRVIRLNGRPVSEYVEEWQPWPQLLVNAGVDRMEGWEQQMESELAAANSRLSGRGRIVVRPSGTQPMIRVMVEADDFQLRDEVTDCFVDALLKKMGGRVHGKVDLTYALGD